MSAKEIPAELAAALAPPPPAPKFDPHFVRNRDVLLRFLEGQAIPDIAMDLGLQPSQIKAILRKQPIKQEIQRLAGLANDRYVQERIDSLTIEALDVVRDTMRGKNFNELRFKAAKELLAKNPLLGSAQTDAARELGLGLGEAIINRLAKLDSDAARTRQEAEIEVKHEEAQIIVETEAEAGTGKASA